MELLEVPVERLLPYRRAAAREHVSVSATQKTVWYEYRDRELIGFGAFIWTGEEKARVKGIYVLPEFRGGGLGTRMTQKIIEAARAAGAKTLEAFALNPAFYEALGWRRTDVRLRSGAWKVVTP